MQSSAKMAAILSLVSASLTFSAEAARLNLKPGLWEIITTMDVPGMPMAMPPATRTQCYTTADLGDGRNIAPTSFRNNEKCALKDYDVRGNRMTWSIQCSDQRASKGTGEMVLNGDSYEGTMKITAVDSRRGEMQMTQHIKGKRIGDCK